MRRFPMLPLGLCCTGSLVLSVVAPSFADKTVTTSTTQTTSSKATTSSDKAVVR